MQRFCHRAGVGIVGWRQSGTADVAATLAPRDNHRRIVTRARHGRVVVGYAGTDTISTTVGNAAANGTTAAITRTIATTVGNAAADGITASITIAGQTVIGCIPGNAVADGAMATVMRTITADPGNAVANGSIAELLRVIAAGPGNAVADGVSASILGATSIVCTPGNAVAAGITASISSGSRWFLGDLSILTTQTDFTVTSGYDAVTVLTVASPLVVTTQTSDLCVQ